MNTRRVLPLAVLTALLASAGCELPPVDSENIGPRGLSMGTVENPSVTRPDSIAYVEAYPADPDPIPGDLPAAPAGTFENVQVLGNLSVAEFNRSMVAMTNWVSPEQGCNYCHVVQDDGSVIMAEDDVYTKVVSRRMIQMTKYINEEWSSHVGEEGVNCYTCHVGQPQPEYVWTLDPHEPNLRYYLDREDVRVQSQAALTGDAEVETSIQNARNTYWFMIHTSNALGVNCTYCHASARFSDWEESPPARVTALRGYRMVRDINQQFVAPLGSILPDSVQGPEGDGPKVQCMTCHQGVNIPAYGLARATLYPALTLPEAVHPAATEEAAADIDMDALNELFMEAHQGMAAHPEAGTAGETHLPDVAGGSR